jgi:hypothetical protein
MERDDKYWHGIFCQKCHNEGQLTKECKLLHKICNLCKREGHEVNDFPLKELGGQYARKDILVNVVQLEILVKQSKQEQNYQ